MAEARGTLPAGWMLLLARQRALFARRPRLRALLLACGLALIPLWQLSFTSAPDSIDPSYYVTNNGPQGRQDLYYAYHFLDLYPVSRNWLTSPAEPTAEGARKMMRTQGSRLNMPHTWDNLYLFLFSVDARLGGDVMNPTYHRAGLLGFILALMALYLAFWVARLEIVGLFTVALIGSDPFQLYAIHVQNNVWSWPMSVAMLLTALHLPALLRLRASVGGGARTDAYLLALPVLSGVIVGTAQHLRAEIVPMLGATALAYVLVRGLSWRLRVALVALLLVAYMGSARGWSAYFENLYLRTAAAVAAAGGDMRKTSVVPPPDYHQAWHPIWSGLGDFDDKYGYNWDDHTAYNYAKPLMAERPTAADQVWNKRQGWNSQMGWDVRYADILREKFLHDVTSDPLWYARIIAKRLWRVTAENTPPSLAWGPHALVLPVPGGVIALCMVAALLAMAWQRQFSALALFAFPLAAGGAAIAVSTEGGIGYYAFFHLVGCAFLAGWLLEIALGLRMHGPAGGRLAPRPGQTIAYRDRAP